MRIAEHGAWLRSTNALLRSITYPVFGLPYPVYGTLSHSIMEPVSIEFV